MTLQIDTANRIIVDGEQTGLALVQRQDRTVVYTPVGVNQVYVEHTMPNTRYAASHDSPGIGVAGRALLEADVRSLIASLRSIG